MKTTLLSPTIALIIALCLTGNVTHAQFLEDFSDGELTNNPSWQGDLSSFEITDDLELRLNADGTAISTLITEYQSITAQEWRIDLSLDFNPSNSNRLIIYLQLDNPDPSIASGYMIEVGENLSNDAFVFKKLNNGVATEIARATDGLLATKPTVSLIVKRDDNSFWTLAADYAGSGIFTQELEFFDDDLSFEAAYFGLSCINTSTNARNFYFDNIYVGDIIVDQSPPELVAVSVLSNTEIELAFNEPLEPSSILDMANYQITPSITINQAAFGDTENLVRLQLADPLQSATTYSIEISGLQDLSANAISNVSDDFFLTEMPLAGDIIVNEILFDPYVGGSDFVEIKNISDKFIKLSDLKIYNLNKEESRSISNTQTILPGEIVAFSADVDFLLDNYQYNEELPITLLRNELPSFNQDEGNVAITNATDDILDSFDYSDDLHFDLLLETKGASLERISDTAGSNDAANWTSAASSIGFATPGYKNSSSFTATSGLNNEFRLAKTVFSPNNDTVDDFLIVEYDLDGSSYVVNVSVYDGVGRPVVDLLKNEQLATSGFFRWDGLNAEGNISEIGPYVLLIEAFNPEGSIINTKKSFVLADFLN